jgi:N-ethylmaleimide reductase
LVPFNDIFDSDPEALVTYVATELNARKIGSLEIRHGDFRGPGEQQLAVIAREHFKGTLLVNGGYDLPTAQAVIESGAADAVVFGKAYLSNPDLVERLRAAAPLTPVDFSKLYTPGPAGYTDYPTMA